MNEYCKHKVIQFHRLFVDRMFDQDDVALLVVLVRDYAKKGSIFRELGDFLAHPIEKDRGLVLNSVKSAASSFEKECQRYFYDQDFKPPIVKGLGTTEELIQDLNAVFLLAGVPKQSIERDDNNLRDFVFCVVFLLSSFKIKHEDRLFELNVEYSHGLTLQLSYESKNYPRHFATMPVLFLGNVWIDCPTVFASPKHALNRHIVRRFQEGIVAAIAYEADIPGRVFTTKDFATGNIWPLPDLPVHHSKSRQT